MCRLKICLWYLSSAFWHVFCFLHNITNFVIKVDIHGLRTICTINISCWTLTCIMIIYHASTWYSLLSSTIRINMAKGFETNPLSSFVSSFSFSSPTCSSHSFTSFPLDPSVQSSMKNYSMHPFLDSVHVIYSPRIHVLDPTLLSSVRVFKAPTELLPNLKPNGRANMPQPENDCHGNGHGVMVSVERNHIWSMLDKVDKGGSVYPCKCMLSVLWPWYSLPCTLS